MTDLLIFEPFLLKSMGKESANFLCHIHRFINSDFKNGLYPFEKEQIDLCVNDMYSFASYTVFTFCVHIQLPIAIDTFMLDVQYRT